MKRFAVTTAAGTMKLYCPTIEKAYTTWPEAKEIVEIEDTAHLEYIDRLLKSCKQTVDHGNMIFGIVETSFGDCKIRLRKDLSDDHYYDYISYQFCEPKGCVYPIIYDISTPKSFVEMYCGECNLSYKILSFCVGKKLDKPKQLKGIKQVTSIPMYGGKVRHGLFLLDDDLYIQCRDYFSPSICFPEDIGTPLSYRAKKYLGKNYKNKFAYPDGWGDIVRRQCAWLEFTDYLPYLKFYGYSTMGRKCCELVRKYHSFDCELEADWRIFYETAAKEISQIVGIT